MKPHGFSLRYQVPVNLSLAILLTGLVVAAMLLWRAAEDLRRDLFVNSLDVGRAMSGTLTAALRHDDVWQAYRALRSASGPTQDERLLLLLDDQSRIFASSHPKKFPVLGELGLMGFEGAGLQTAIEGHADLEPFTHEDARYEHLYVVAPLLQDGVVVGTLVMVYPRAILWPRLAAIAGQVAVSTLLAMGALIPLGWYVGKRTVAPLTELAECMSQVGKRPAEEIRRIGALRHDEIGQVGQVFATMLESLKQKEALERQVVVSERLAALGRLAAGVAHEINNPVGGMLNAINTFKHFGYKDPIADKTMSLLERGLHQIQETVAALLVEARAETHPLTPTDVDDVRTLIAPDAQKKSLRLSWENNLDKALPLPSTSVRQVLLNLSLNAVQAAERGGQISLSIGCPEDLLDIRVENDGEPISEQDLPRLFEPFVRGDGKGAGLGLWVTYQIVQQLRGDISVHSDNGHTCFNVRLPLEDAA